MARFRLPVFNLLCNISEPFIAGEPIPPVPPFRLTNQECALVYGRRVNVMSTGGTEIPGVPIQAMNLLLPKQTDVRGPQDTISFDCVEVPAGTGRWYQVCMVDDIGKGYANEHRTACLFAIAFDWGAPYP